MGKNKESHTKDPNTVEQDCLGDDYGDCDANYEYDFEVSKLDINVMPSRRTINRYLEDAAILNLKYVGNSIINKSSDATCTLGLDDVKKSCRTSIA